jgi:tRNA-Thr(GGU) m(6)t(6)A37 methyltransferase TsaA
MAMSRRALLGTGAAMAAGLAAGRALADDAAAQKGDGPAAPGKGGDAAASAGAAPQVFTMTPIGRIEVKDKSARIVLEEKYAPGLAGLADWSHVQVFYWFDKNDVPQKRAILQVRPRGSQDNPLTGVFACRSPVRPNLVALTVCRIVSVEGNVVTLDAIDAFDGTPVIDLKPFIPPDEPRGEVRVPAWARRGPGGPGAAKE